MARIAILDDYQNVALQMADWSAVTDRTDVTVFNDHVADPDQLIARLTPFDVVFVMRERTPLPRSIIERLPNLKMIASTGPFNASIDMAAAEDHGIHVGTTGGTVASTVELTWALILAVTRRIVEADTFLRAGKFDGWDFDMLLGSGLSGKTLGIVGFGRIGKAVARRAMGFGMSVIYCGRDDIAYRDDSHYNAQILNRQNARQAATAPLTQSARSDGMAARRVTFHQLLELSDIVTLHVPLAATTQHLVNAAAFTRMKPTAYLINTARGPVIDEAALVEALQQHRIAGAGLDVFEHEPTVNAPLLEMPNVVLLPHIGSATLETRTAMAMLAVENSIDALSGKKPRNLVWQ